MWNMLLCEEGWNTATLPAFWKIYPSAYAASCTQRLVMRITTELDPKGEKPEWEPGFEQARKDSMNDEHRQQTGGVQ